jgi:hypothetical protein
VGLKDIEGPTDTHVMDDIHLQLLKKFFNGFCACQSTGGFRQTMKDQVGIDRLAKVKRDDMYLIAYLDQIPVQLMSPSFEATP